MSWDGGPVREGLEKEANIGAGDGRSLKIWMGNSYRCRILLYRCGQKEGFGEVEIRGFEETDEFEEYSLRRSLSTWPARQGD